jgi:hypothetical protein
MRTAGASPLSLVPVLAIGLFAAGCVSQQQQVANKEDLLSAAGFTVRPADTPQRQAQLASLPPHHFIQKDRNGKIIFLYADPLVCGCLYIGDQPAYDRYRQEVFQRHLADQQALTAEMNENASWDWSPWGPGWWYY